MLLADLLTMFSTLHFGIALKYGTTRPTPSISPTHQVLNKGRVKEQSPRQEEQIRQVRENESVKLGIVRLQYAQIPSLSGL